LQASRTIIMPSADVADEVAVARVAAGAALVGELLQLADVVQHDAGEDEIVVRAVSARDEAGRLRPSS
jgi:hypothetical protein